MPVAVIALAAGSFAAGASAFAAAGTLAGMVAAGATMAGAAMTIVGTVTGNAKLTKIGAIVGIVGGLGTAAINMAASAGSAAGAVGTAGEAVADGAGAAAGAAESAAGTLPVVAPGGIEALGDAAASTTGSAASTAANAAGTTGGGMLSAATNTAAQGATGGTDLLAQSLQDSTSTFNPSTLAGQTGNAFDASATAAGQANTLNAFKAPTTGGMLGSIESYPGAIDAAAGAGSAGSSFMGDVGAWAKANPELAKMALNGIGTAASNLVPSARDKAMMDAYKAQSASSNAQTAALNRKALWGSGRI